MQQKCHDPKHRQRVIKKWGEHKVFVEYFCPTLFLANKTPCVLVLIARKKIGWDYNTKNHFCPNCGKILLCGGEVKLI